MRPAGYAVVFLLGAHAVSAAPVVIRDHDHLALAPKGERMANVEASDPGNLADSPHSVVVVRDASGKVQAAYDPCRACQYADTAWSPSGDALAFIATDRKRGTATLYAVEKKTPRALAVIKGIANTVRYSPDGARIALLATIGARKLTGAVEAGAALVGEIGESNDEQRIGIVSAKGGALRLVSPADTYIYEYDWTPDGKGFAVTSAKGNGDNNWWIATLDYVDGATGAMRRIAAPKMQIELPRVSPDGKTVAFIGGLMSDWQSIGGDIYVVPLAGGEPRDIRPDFAGSFRSLDWRGSRLMTGAQIGGLYSVALYDPQTGQLQPPDFFFRPMSVRSQGVNSSVVSSADGKTVAMIAEDFNHAYEIFAGGTSGLVPITHDNSRLAQNVAVQNVGWTNEGFHLQGWLVGPKQTQPGTKYPMVV
ncbi:MAG TPA: S9 family peptidase, partial [Phycisphaerae bacterium]|nr:S9 family peptidase [Phycisphaerae bacterium]